MRKKCSCMPLFIQDVFDLKAKALLKFKNDCELDPDGKLKGLQVTIQWSSGLQRWTTVLRIACSIQSRG